MYTLFRFDILVDEKFEPSLLEVNHTPSLRTDSNVDYFVKKNLIKNVLNLIHVCPL